ncbi:ABC transporter substrate-binding protein [Neisseriaceae bacterium CLB008]
MPFTPTFKRFSQATLMIMLWTGLAACQPQTATETTQNHAPTAASQPQEAAVTVTDMLDRTVTLAAPAKHIVLSEGRHIMTLGLLDQNPLSLVAAWGNDLKRYSPAAFDALVAKFPEASKMPEVGGTSDGTFSMEATIAAKPDLVIFTLYGPPPEGLDKLDSAGIPYVFVDFFREPIKNTVPSMRMLGQLLNREAEAEAFIAYYEQHVNSMTERVQSSNHTPTVFFHLNPDGQDCCFSNGKGNMSDFIAAAGGHNIGLDKIPGAFGKLNLEYILDRNPDFYLAGGGSSVTLNGLHIGPNVAPAEAKQTLDNILQGAGIRELKAVQKGQASGIWLFFFDTPLWFVGSEALAQMLHPDLFPANQADATMTELNQNFMAFPLQGTFWMNATKNER